jgi:hypothetical protein
MSQIPTRNLHIPRYVVVMLVPGILNIWLISSYQPEILPHEVHNDAYFVRFADSVLRGQWMSDYDVLL